MILSFKFNPDFPADSSFSTPFNGVVASSGPSETGPGPLSSTSWMASPESATLLGLGSGSSSGSGSRSFSSTSKFEATLLCSLSFSLSLSLSLSLTPPIGLGGSEKIDEFSSLPPFPPTAFSVSVSSSSSNPSCRAKSSSKLLLTRRLDGPVFSPYAFEEDGSDSVLNKRDFTFSDQPLR
ncbi:hypothetical protein HanIR_Chr03g0106111 [Helianthus annuus]|nr:hypothetical protein HanIR_Chr03g0106111 [Helianthus annuus]